MRTRDLFANRDVKFRNDPVPKIVDPFFKESFISSSTSQRVDEQSYQQLKASENVSVLQDVWRFGVGMGGGIFGFLGNLVLPSLSTALGRMSGFDFRGKRDHTKMAQRIFVNFAAWQRGKTITFRPPSVYQVSDLVDAAVEDRPEGRECTHFVSEEMRGSLVTGTIEVAECGREPVIWSFFIILGLFKFVRATCFYRSVL